MFAILISTKNRKADLVFTLQQMVPLLERDDVEFVVYDDGSSDGTSEAVAENFPKVKLLRNEISKGYMFCRNQMLNETAADYAISLDDDAHFLSENPLDEIQAYFSGNPKCGLIAFRIFWNTKSPINTLSTQNPHRVQGFVGCGHAWRMEAWRSIPDYPLWFEFYGEEDFSALHLLKQNWEVHYVPQVLIQHRVDMKLRSQLNKDFGFRYRRSLRSGWYSYLMLYPASKIPRIIAYSGLMQLKKIFKGNFKIINPFFGAGYDLILNARNLFKNRAPLTISEYETYRQLKETKIFWTPEK